MPATLGYYKARGLTHHIRYLLEYTGENYVDYFYRFGPPPEYDRSHWAGEKFKLGLDFPNVPYYIDGEVKLSQSSAIFRYIAAKHNLLGESNVDRAKADMLVAEGVDLILDFGKLIYNPDFDNAKNDFIADKMKPKLTQLSKFIGSNDWFIGNKISYADFIIYEVLFRFKLLSEATVSEFGVLRQFMKRFEALEPIKKYVNSDRYFKLPIAGPTAYFGGK